MRFEVSSLARVRSGCCLAADLDRSTFGKHLAIIPRGAVLRRRPIRPILYSKYNQNRPILSVLEI
jgi:hypothetical protein